MWNKLKSLFGGKSKGEDDEDSDNPATRQQERVRKAQRRRDEFITKRELETLRKARLQRDAIHQAAMSRSNPANQKSQSASGAPKEDTLRKINEIERMMSVDVKGAPKSQPSELNRAFLPTEPIAPNSHRPVVIQQPSNPFAPTMTDEQRMAAAFQKTDVITPRARPGPQASGDAVASAPDFFAPTEHINPASALTTFTPTQALSVEVQELSHDPVLEEAAIHFANGEYAEAESVLTATVSPTGPAHRSTETWRALFDLYRAIGAQAKFEALGLDFVSLFETSAPNWFSLADEASSAGAGSTQPAAVRAGAQTTYTCQPNVDAWAANQMNQFVETRLLSNTPVVLDFERLQTIGADGAEVLTRCLVSLNKSHAKVSVTRAANLADACEKLTPPGDPTVPQGLWLLRLEVLRLLGRNEEFENAALDYCVTYEVSPPAWQQSSVSISFADQSTPAPNWELAAEEPTLRLAPISQQPGTGDASAAQDLRALQPAGGVLSGEITAGMAVIGPELQKAARNNPVTVSCARLKRVDFASAGTLLNWVLELQGEGRQVQFIDTHRLIAAFFNVIGISGHARVSLRKD